MCKNEYETRMSKWRRIWALKGKQGRLYKVEEYASIFFGVIIAIALAFSIGIFQGEYPFNETWKNVLLCFVLLHASFAVGIIPMILVRNKIEEKIGALNIEIKHELDNLRKG